MGLKENLINEELILIPAHIAKIPIMDLSGSRKNFGFGFSSELAFIIWAIWGGFLLYMLESNYLAVLIQPTYEKPIKTLDDVIGMIPKVTVLFS